MTLGGFLQHLRIIRKMKFSVMIFPRDDVHHVPMDGETPVSNNEKLSQKSTT